MDLENIKTIKMSLMKRDSNIKDNKAEYLKKITGKFIIPSDFNRNEKAFELLINNIFNSLVKENISSETDSVGIWIEYYDNSSIIENAISLQTLDDIKQYSTDSIIPIFEFFKMTLQNND